jgi:hypothetical protein
MMNARRDVVILDTRFSPLPHAMLDRYLADLRAWVAERCRAAGGRAPLALIDALYADGGSPAGFARWESIGPHAGLRREYGLSPDAVAILLVAAAPRMWGMFAHVYAAVAGRVEVDANVLGVLLGDRAAAVRELDRSAPLVAFGLVSVRASGAVVPSAEVVCRLAGN